MQGRCTIGGAKSAMTRRNELNSNFVKFQHPCSGFGVFAAAVIEFVAVQRGWRDFRKAQ